MDFIILFILIKNWYNTIYKFFIIFTIFFWCIHCLTEMMNIYDNFKSVIKVSIYRILYLLCVLFIYLITVCIVCPDRLTNRYSDMVKTCFTNCIITPLRYGIFKRFCYVIVVFKKVAYVYSSLQGNTLFHTYLHYNYNIYSKKGQELFIGFFWKKFLTF